MGSVNEQSIYGVRTKDSITLKNSTSGGVFTVISDLIIEEGGMVCGAVYNSNYEVKHVISNSKNVRDGMRGAKYVQSEIKDVIPDIIKYLESNYVVLFSGTPCQVAAIKRIVSMKKLGEKLVTIDIICHGVPSPGIFKEHIKLIEEKYGAIKSYIFRDKQKGWRGQNVTIMTEKGVVSDEDAKIFSSLYFNSLIIRPSCNNCHFASIKRVGDITIGDFWGVSQENISFDDNLGISQVMINTEKGKRIFDKIRKQIEYFEVKSNCYIQPNMVKSTERNPIANTFWSKYKKGGIEYGGKILKTLRYRMIVYKIFDKIRYMMRKKP